ncbi:MAG: hypothetical protein ABI379_12685 [Rhodanobacter sp.]
MPGIVKHSMDATCHAIRAFEQVVRTLPRRNPAPVQPRFKLKVRMKRLLVVPMNGMRPGALRMFDG